MKIYPHHEGDEIIQLVPQSELLKAQAAVAELLERLRDRTESHLLASARDVETIQRQAVLLDRLAGALRAIDALRNDDFPFGGDFSDKATTAFVGASDALVAYEAAKKGES